MKLHPLHPFFGLPTRVVQVLKDNDITTQDELRSKILDGTILQYRKFGNECFNACCAWLESHKPDDGQAQLLADQINQRSRKQRGFDSDAFTWFGFATNALRGAANDEDAHLIPKRACLVADEMLAEYRKRFPNQCS